MAFTTTCDSKGTIVVAPRNVHDHTATAVFCHGLGDSANSWQDVAECLASHLPYIKFIIPTAEMQRMTTNMGQYMTAWYDIVSKKYNAECPGIDASQQQMLRTLKSEHDKGIPYNRMVLIGFSQGGALCLYTGMQMPLGTGPLAGIVMISGYLPRANAFKITPGLQDTPIFHGHGALDLWVRVTAARKSKILVTEKGAREYTLKIYKCLGHSANPKEWNDVLAFLKKCLPPTDECWIKLDSS